MGLDSYLGRQRKFEQMSFKDVNKLAQILYGLEELCPNAVKEMKNVGLIYEQGTHYKYHSTNEQVGYWRKANQIHAWFVENVQGGTDDCNSYEVTKEQLETLLGICKTIKKSCKLVKGTVNNGYTFDSTMKMVGIQEEGKVMTNSEVAHKLLPSRDGFFFGSTDYDQWYMQDIDSTIEILTKVLKETDFNTHTISYQSSW